MIEYTLLPIYSRKIPLESFMSSGQAEAFRRAIRNATEQAWAAHETCVLDPTCTTGYCRPVVDVAAKRTTYVCQQPGTIATELPAPMSARAKRGVIPDRPPLAAAGMLPVPALQILQLRIAALCLSKAGMWADGIESRVLHCSSGTTASWG